MGKEGLRNEFRMETATNWENSQGEPDIDYVEWLEKRILYHSMQQEQIKVIEGIKEIVLEQSRNGNIVVSTFEGLKMAALKDIVKQPIDGLLYDLNRNEAVILTFIKDPKWINDYAAVQVIRELKSQAEESVCAKLIDLYKEYCALLKEELDSCIGMASIHGWASTPERINKGKELRDKIDSLIINKTE